jgi:hypothetical protein
LPSILPTQLFFKSPPNVYVAIVPKTTSANKNNSMTSTITGKESKIVETSFGIPGTFLITFKGLKILNIFTDYIP